MLFENIISINLENDNMLLEHASILAAFIRIPCGIDEKFNVAASD